MTEKYTDLTEEIWRADEGLTSLGSVEMVLDYLDTHPDQVPGRTITASELRERSHYMTDDERVTFLEGVSAVGGRVVPDPEPTNAEKLDKIMEEWPGRATASDPTFGEYLHNRGVKAPGGDE